jgi:hypothetical protein
MNLYLISQDVNTGYDTYDSAVVAAPSEEDARLIHPNGKRFDEIEKESEPYLKNIYITEWCKSEKVTVKLIGVAVEGFSGVICSSFNAG